MYKKVMAVLVDEIKAMSIDIAQNGQKTAKLGGRPGFRTYHTICPHMQWIGIPLSISECAVQGLSELACASSGIPAVSKPNN